MRDSAQARPYHGIWLMLLAALPLLACTRHTPTMLAPRTDLAYRLVELAPCPQCLPLEISDATIDATPRYAGLTLIASTDIHSVIANFDDNGLPVIDLQITKDAHARIQRASGENVGRQLVLLAGGKVLQTVTIASPFADSIRVSGLMSIQEQRELMSHLTPNQTTGN